MSEAKIQDSIKVSPELDARYEDACELCRQKHFKIYGEYPAICSFRAFDNEYCPDIATAERKRLEKEKLSPTLSAYLKSLERNNGMAYNFILYHALDFSREELIAIIRAFDYVISPYLVRINGLETHEATDIYRAVAKFTRNELTYSVSEVWGDCNRKSIEEIINEIETGRRKREFDDHENQLNKE